MERTDETSDSRRSPFSGIHDTGFGRLRPTLVNTLSCQVNDGVYSFQDGRVPLQHIPGCVTRSGVGGLLRGSTPCNNPYRIATPNQSIGQTLSDKPRPARYCNLHPPSLPGRYLASIFVSHSCLMPCSLSMTFSVYSNATGASDSSSLIAGESSSVMR